MAVSRYHIKMALKNRAYMEARLTTHMIHNSFCEAVSKGESDALRLLWNQYEGDLEDEEAEEMKTRLPRNKKEIGLKQTG